MTSINGNGENKLIYPVYKDEISFADSVVSAKKIASEDMVDESHFSGMIEYVLEQLKNDNINYVVEIKNALALFFRKAYKNNLYINSSEEKKTYANDIATKLEIQLMLDNSECATEDDVLKIYDELLGDLPDEGPDDNGFNVVAMIEDCEETSESKTKSNFAQMIAWEKTKIKTENSDKESMESFVLPDIDTENGYTTVLEAIKIGGKYPRKKGDNSDDVIDVDYINALNEQIGDGEKILFASYCKVCYDNTESMSKSANGAYRPSFLNNIFQILAITDKKIYLCKSLYEISVTVIDRDDLKSINSIYEKKHDSLGQIQFGFRDGHSLIITIDKPIKSNGNEKEIFDANVLMISALFVEDVMKKEAESDYIEAVKHRYLKKIRVIEYLLNDEENRIKVSDIDKFIIKTIVENTSSIYEEIIENPSADIDKLIFMVQESVIDERLNKLFGDDIFIINKQWEAMDDDVKPLVNDVIEKTTESLDRLEIEIRKQLDGDVGNQDSSSEDLDIPNEEQLYKELDQLLGLEEVKAKIRELVEFEKINAEQKKPSLEVPDSEIGCMCFVGNKGAGKATVAHIYEQLLYANGVASTNKFVEIEDSDFDLETEEEIKGVFDIVKMHSEGGIALFSDIDKVIQKPNATMILDQLVGFIENNRNTIRVIIAGKEEAVVNFIESNDSFKGRFRTIISFENIPVNQLIRVFVSIMRQRGFTIEPEALNLVAIYFEKISKEADFANIDTVFEAMKKLVDIHIQSIKETNDRENLRVIVVNDVKTLLEM
ncbi:MAG: AAA family ATPase [Lachnospiraceae bacterium]|nr:AAA family ATPase [Lachnospiraceae bacterium]